MPFSAGNPEHECVTTRPDTLPRYTDFSGPGVSDGGELDGDELDPSEDRALERRDFDGEQGGDESAPRLTVAAVARRLGVAPATLRTWDRRYGLGPGGHTSGRHRRYGPDDIARLERMQRALLRGASPAEAARYACAASATAAEQDAGGARRQFPRAREQEPVLVSGVLDEDDEPPVEPETSVNTGGRGLKLTGVGPRARGLGRAALALDSRSAQQLLLEGFQDDGVVTTWHEVLEPVLRALAEQRQSTGSGGEALPLLTDSASTALRAVIAHAPQPLNPRPVVLTPVPGEDQSLELVALAAALAAGGVGQRLFGATALPQEGVDAVVRRVAPAAVVLWSEQSHYAAANLLDEIPNPRQRVRVFAGGRGWLPESASGHVEVSSTLDSAVERVTAVVLG